MEILHFLTITSTARVALNVEARKMTRPDFEQFVLWEGCGGLERSDFEQFVLWEGVVVLKEVILNSLYFGRVLWS